MRVLALLTAAILAVPASANACSIGGPLPSTTAREVAEHGIFIRGRLIQAFDPDRELPEIISVDQMYVGDKQPTALVIYHPKSDYEKVRKLRRPRDPRSPPPLCPDWMRRETELGKTFDRLALMPAHSASDPAANGRWVFEFWGGNISREKGLDQLLQAAAQAGRLIVRPAKDGAENCRECAPKD